MDRNFYLWSKLALGIGCVEMKKLRDYLMESVKLIWMIKEIYPC